MNTVRIFQWTTRIGGLIGLGALILGLLFWIFNLNVINVHMLLGILVALTLLVLGIALLCTRGLRVLGIIGVIYALILPIFGLTQATIFTGNAHWLIQLAHMLVGIGALALLGIMGARYTRLKQGSRIQSPAASSPS